MNELEKCKILLDNNLIDESCRLATLTFLERNAKDITDKNFFYFFYVQFSMYLFCKEKPLISELCEGDMISDLILDKYNEVKSEIESNPFKIENYCSVFSSYEIDFPLIVS